MLQAHRFDSLKKAHQQRGQALPMMLIVFPIILLLMIYKGMLWHQGNQKMSIQKNADARVLLAALPQAQALNAIAALNEGLNIAQRRAFIFSTTLLTLRVCAALTLFQSPCSIAWSRLEPQAVPFFKKFKALVTYMADQQDILLNWANEAPTATTRNTFNIIDLSQTWAVVSAQDTHGSIPIYRAGSHRQFSTTSEESDFADGNDISRCHHKEFKSYARYQTFEPKIISQFSPADRMVVTYTHKPSGNTRVITITNKRDLITIKLNRLVHTSQGKAAFTFTAATWHKCETLHSLLAKLNNNTSLGIKIPPPYMFDKAFFQDGNRISLAMVNVNRNSPFDELRFVLPPHTKFVWSLSEGKVTGTDLMNMDFDVRLSDVSKAEITWQHLKKTLLKRQPWIAVNMPDYKEFSDILNH